MTKDDGLTTWFLWTVHTTHRFVADSDNAECDRCSVRPYSDEAKQPCPEDHGHGGENR